MKNSVVFLEKLPIEVSKKSRSGTQKASAHPYKSKAKKIPEKRYGLPPMAPHNTTDDIIDSHPMVLFDEEELQGSSPCIMRIA